MMYLFCGICNKETKHSHGGVQHLPRGSVDLYNCSKCKGTQSVPQSGFTVLTNSYDTGQPMTGTGQQLTRAQERETLHQPGKWDGGSYVVSKPKRRGLFG